MKKYIGELTKKFFLIEVVTLFVFFLFVTNGYFETVKPVSLQNLNIPNVDFYSVFVHNLIVLFFSMVLCLILKEFIGVFFLIDSLVILFIKLNVFATVSKYAFLKLVLLISPHTFFELAGLSCAILYPYFIRKHREINFKDKKNVFISLFILGIVLLAIAAYIEVFITLPKIERFMLWMKKF